jgi:hypothetical protein
MTTNISSDDEITILHAEIKRLKRMNDALLKERVSYIKAHRSIERIMDNEIITLTDKIRIINKKNQL